MDRNVTVRPATPADAAYISDLAKRTAMSSVSAYRSAPTPIVLESLDRLLGIVNGSSHVALIAMEDGTPVGFVVMLDRLPDEVTGMAQGFVAYMAVEPDARRHGVGGALLKAAEDEAKRRGLPYMALMVTEDNEPARTLYERAGYVTERRLLCKRL